MNYGLQEIKATQHQGEAARQIQKARITWDEQPGFFQQANIIFLKKNREVYAILKDI